MRILHTCLRYPPATGGAETYVREIVERTRSIEEKRDVRVITSNMRTHGPVTELSPEQLLDDPIYVQRLFHVSTPFVSYPRLQSLKYYMGHHKPDIIHAYSFWYHPADEAARYAQMHHIPFFLHPMYYEYGVRNKIKWQLYKYVIGKRTFSAADVVIVISPFEKRLIEKERFSVKRFELIPPGVDTHRFSTVRDNPFLKRHITGDIVLTVSRIEKMKGVDDVIRVMPDVIRHFKDANLCIVGEDFGEKQNLLHLSEKQGTKDHVHFMGRLSDDDLIGAYQHAKVLVHPTHYEAFGIAMAESLAAGTPVIARNTSAVPYVVPHEKAGILFSSREELLKAIRTLISDDSLRSVFSIYGKKYVANTFSWDASIKKVTDLYEEYGHPK